MRTRRYISSPGDVGRRYVSLDHERSAVIERFHRDVIKKTETLLGHTFFEIVCEAPKNLHVSDLEHYAVQWIDKGWSASVVTEYLANNKPVLSLRLRSYVDAIPL